MGLKLTDLYKIDSDEFRVVELSLRNASQTHRNIVALTATSRPNTKVLSRLLNNAKISKYEIAKSAGVKKQVVSDLFRGRGKRKSPSMKKLFKWIFENGFKKAFEKKKAHTCTCVHCGNRHKSKPLLMGE